MCPLIGKPAMDTYRRSVQAASELSIEIQRFLDGHDHGSQAIWLKASLSKGRDLFQPWNMEIIYLTAIWGRSRFSELEGMLGVSSRTLSSKLRLLTESGLLERTVYDEQPVRIEYTLTKHGKAVAALASPLFTHLNFQALKAAGRRVPGA